MPDKKLTEAVRRLRIALGDTQQSFAQRLGIAISSAVRYESNRAPSGFALAQLARVARENKIDDCAKELEQALAHELFVNPSTHLGKLRFESQDDGSQHGYVVRWLMNPEERNYGFAFSEGMDLLRSKNPELQKRARAILQKFQVQMDALIRGKQ